MGEKGTRRERSCDTTGRAVGRVRTARTGPATRGAQGCQIRECAIVDAGGFCKKSGDLVRERQAVKFAAIADWADLGTQGPGKVVVDGASHDDTPVVV